MQTIGFTDQFCILTYVFFASNLNVLFVQGMSVDLCPQMTQLPLNSFLIFTQVQCSSVVWLRPIVFAALNNWTGSFWQVEAEPPLLLMYTLLHHSSFVAETFWITTLVSLDERLATMNHKNTNNKRRMCCIWSVKPLICINKSPVTVLMYRPVLRKCRSENQAVKPHRPIAFLFRSCLPKCSNKMVA